MCQVVTLKAQTVPASNNPQCQVGLLHVNDDFKSVLHYAQTTNDYILNTSVYLPSANTFAQKGIFWTKDKYKSPNSDAVFSRNTSGVMPCTINQKLGEYGAFGVNYGQYFDSKNGLFRYYSLDLSKNAKVKLTLKNNGGSTINVRLFLTDSTFSETRALNADPSIKTANYTLGDEYYYYKVIAPGASATFDVDFSTAVNIFYTGGTPLFEVNNGMNFNLSKVCGLGIIVRNNTFNASFQPLALNNYPIEISNFSIGDVTEKCPNTITGLDDINFNLNTAQKNITLKAVSSAGLPITYTVNDTAIATVKGDILTIKKNGQTYIQATSGGGSTNFANASKSADLYVGNLSASPIAPFTLYGTNNTFPQKLVITGENLATSISVGTFSTSYYEFSNDSAGTYGNSGITLPSTGGVIWVRGKNIKITDVNLPEDDIILSSENIYQTVVFPNQELLAKPSVGLHTNSPILNSFITTAETPSQAQYIIIEGLDLQDSLKIEIQDPFKLSLDSTFSNNYKTLSFLPDSKGYVKQKVWIRIQSNGAEIIQNRTYTLSSKYASVKTKYIPDSKVYGNINVKINNNNTTSFNAFNDTLNGNRTLQKISIKAKGLTQNIAFTSASTFAFYTKDTIYKENVVFSPNTEGEIDTAIWLGISSLEQEINISKQTFALYSTKDNEFETITLTIPTSSVVKKGVNINKPIITLSKNTLDKFTTISGSPSKAQYFIITSSYLSKTLTIISASNYQIGFKNIDTAFYISNIKIPKHNNINQKDTIWVRIWGNSSATGIISAEEISITGDIDSTISIPEGEIKLPDPEIIITSSLDTFETKVGTPSKEQFFKLEAKNIFDSLTVYSPWGFEIRNEDDENWKDSIVIKPFINDIESTNIYVRIKEKPEFKNFTTDENNFYTSLDNSNYIYIKSPKSSENSVIVKYIVKPLVISVENNQSDINTDSIKIKPNPEFNIDYILFKYKGLSEKYFSAETLTAENNKYLYVIDPNLTSDVGLEYYIFTKYNSTFSDSTEIRYLYKTMSYNTSRQVILPKGSTQSAYKIISFPFDVENKPVSEYLGHLGTYNIKKWRFFKYLTDFKEYNNTGFSYLKNGEAYMLIVRDGDTLPEYKAQKPIEANQSKPFTIQLKSGWNLIGNPYNFDVSWSDVLDANPSLNNTALRGLNNGNFENSTSILKSFSGGFVNVNSAFTITIPCVKSGTQRLAQVQQYKANTNINSELDWDINFVIEQNSIRNNFVGIGMNPEADSAYDNFDDEAMPRFIDYVDLYTTCKVSNKHKHLSKDVVKSTENHTWNYEFETNNSTEPVTIKWQQPSALSNDVYLVDQSAQKIISLKSIHSYSFAPTGEKQLFRLVYGNESYLNQALDFSHSSIINIAPNPSADNINVQFYATQTDADAQSSSIKVKNITGNTVSSFNISAFEGMNTQKINISHLPSGIYILDLNIGNQAFNQKIIKQ